MKPDFHWGYRDWIWDSVLNRPDAIVNSECKINVIRLLPTCSEFVTSRTGTRGRNLDAEIAILASEETTTMRPADWSMEVVTAPATTASTSILLVMLRREPTAAGLPISREVCLLAPAVAANNVYN